MSNFFLCDYSHAYIIAGDEGRAATVDQVTVLLAGREDNEVII